MQPRGETSPVEPEPLGDYLSLPKTVGAVPATTLLHLADKHIQDTQPDRLHSVVHNSMIASSAIIEAMLVTKDDEHHHDDIRLDYIEQAKSCLQYATQAQDELIDRGGVEPLNAEIDLQRMTLNFDFMQVYRDLVCGEVTEETKQEVCVALESRLDKLNKQMENPYNKDKTKAKISGLMGEITALLHYWQQYGQAPGDLVAVPSTRRGGDGTKRPSETHDLIFFKESQPGVFTYQQAREVKAGRAVNRIKSIGRYAHSILNIDHKNRKITETI